MLDIVQIFSTQEAITMGGQNVIYRNNEMTNRQDR